MKILRNILMIMLSIGLIISCSKPDPISTGHDLNMGLKKGKIETKTVTVPFEVNLLGELVSFDLEAADCIDEGYLGRVILEANGTATHMGKVSLTFNFCALGPDDPDVPGEDNMYAGSSAVLVAANGDKLFLNLEGGTVIIGRTDDHPEYVTDYFRDIVTITGGTGRFEGATGELQMDDFDTNIDEYSHHHWTGTITLVKGKR